MLPCLLVLLALLVGACGPVLLPEDARIRQVVGEQHADVWSKGDVELIDQLYTEDYVGHFPGTRVEGRAALKAFVLAHRQAFPDWTETVQSVLVDGEQAATRFVSTGTQRGEFMGIPATGRSVRIEEASLLRFENGRIAEQWAFPDVTALTAQLGGTDRPVADR